MGLFSKTKSYLGVDIGSASVKIVELTNFEGKPRLSTYGYIDWPTNITRSNTIETREKIVYLIKAICKKANTKSRKAVTALPSFSVFSSIISLPLMPKKDLASAVLWEAKKFVPMPIEEVVLDWKRIDETESMADKPKGANKTNDVNGKEKENNNINIPEKKSIRVLLTAAPKNLVKKYIDIFKAAELELLSLETESFALGRSLVGHEPFPVMIIDLGATASDIIIMEKGIPLLSRSIDIGGATITKSIMSILNIDESRAEQFKRDIGVSFTAPVMNLVSEEEPIQFPGLSQNRGQGGIPRAIREVLDSLVNEIRYLLELYQSQGNQNIEKIVLSGGSAFLPNLVGYLSQILTIKVYIGNPWSRIIYPKEMEISLNELGPRFAVAVGLALREAG